LLLGLIEYFILRPAPLIESLTWQTVWLPALILLVFTGVLEEVIFRGVMQHTAIGALGRLGLFYVAAIFAVLHLGYRSILDVLFVFAVAVLFGLLVPRRGSLLGVSLAHGLTNISST
jgi:membrane protease YdiL (CAAX protease family)